MSTGLKRFTHPLATTKEALADALTGGEVPGTEPTSTEIDLSKLSVFLEDLDPGLSGTELDSQMIEPVHENLTGLDRREAAQPEVWQWLSVVAFRELPWRRWCKDPFPATDQERRHYLLEHPGPGGLPGRYLGKAGIGSLARNTFARLWWAAEVLKDPEAPGDYDLARKAAGNAQLFVDVFERRLGLNPQIARACVTVLHDSDADTVKATVRGIQQRAMTTRIEALSEKKLSSLVAEIAASAPS